jgi:uncharacterized damage-inducible protein DinB
MEGMESSSAPLTTPKAHDVAPPYLEPWMRGPIEGVNPLIAPALYAFDHAREDLAKWTADLTTEEIWATPHGFGSVGFHLRHLAGSTERLLNYVEGKQLSSEQMAFLQAEHQPGATREELLAAMDAAFKRVEAVVRTLDPASYTEFRGVGRKQLPTTVIGLLVHIAEHTHRHIGQAISAAKLSKVSTKRS